MNHKFIHLQKTTALLKGTSHERILTSKQVRAREGFKLNIFTINKPFIQIFTAKLLFLSGNSTEHFEQEHMSVNTELFPFNTVSAVPVCPSEQQRNQVSVRGSCSSRSPPVLPLRRAWGFLSAGPSWPCAGQRRGICSGSGCCCSSRRCRASCC